MQFWRLFGVYLCVFCGAAFAANDRIVKRPTKSERVVLQVAMRPETIAANDLGRVDPSMQIEYATLLLRPAEGLESFLVEASCSSRVPRAPPRALLEPRTERRRSVSSEQSRLFVVRWVIRAAAPF